MKLIYLFRMPMKRFLFGIINLFLFTFLLVPKAIASDTGWTINQFDSHIKINQNSEVEIQETITVDFSNLSKHGIYRNIPIDYKDRFGNKLNIRLKILSVTDGQGKNLKYQTKKLNKEIEIKIGDPDTTVSSINTYRIVYLVKRIITRFDDHDEFYWNVTGDNWPVTILNAGVEVEAPADIINTACFTGQFGSKFSSCLAQAKNQTAIYTSEKSILPGEGFTIVAAVPKEKIDEIPFSTQIIWFLTDNWPYALPIVTLLLLLRIYWQNGRDEQYKSLFDPTRGISKLPFFRTELIPSTYAPLNDILPAEAGTLIDEEINVRDLAASIINLAVRGYLEIKEESKGKLLKRKDYKLTWIKKELDELQDFEQKLLISLFGKSKTGNSVMLSELKYNFSSHLAKIRDSLYDQMVEKGYFKRRPDKEVVAYRGIGLAVSFLGSFAFSFSIAWAFAFIASGIIIFFFAKAMPRRTANGRKQYLRVLGLRNFVALGSYREQIWERANLFEEVMPYAIAFNLTHKWAEAFENISVPKPSWYSGSSAFNPNAFAYSMESFTRSTSVTLPATRSASSGGSGFSGGGFSGGGFGGGGGGSW